MNTLRLLFAALLALSVVIGNPYRAGAAAAPEWTLAQNVLPSYKVTSSPRAGATLPDLRVTYTKPYSYIANVAWIATCDLPTPLDMSKDTRFTCTLQTDAGNGWYSGGWGIVFMDNTGKLQNYKIGKEAWRARQPLFVEQALTGLPPGFDLAHVVKFAVVGYASVHAQTATVHISQITFDAKSVGEADARRAKRWGTLQAGVPAPQSFLAHQVMAMTKLYRDDWQSDWMAAGKSIPARLDAARGGHDDFQIAVLPGRQTGSSLHLSVGALAGPKGATIPASAVKLYQMLWVPTLPEGRPDIYEGWYPDILQPITNNTLPLDRRVLSDIWVDVQAPRDAAPGVYQGSVSLRQGNTTQNIPIRLTVHHLTLPVRPTLRTSFWFHPAHFAQFNKIPLDSLKFSDYKPYIDLALQNEVTPILYDSTLFHVIPKADGTYDVDLTKWEQYYSYVMTHGGNCVDLGDTCWFGSTYLYPGNVSFPGETAKDAAIHAPNAIPPHRQQILKTYLDTAHGFLKQHGWDQFSYLQLYDEIPDQAETMTVAYPAVKNVSPETLIAQTQGPLPSYAKWVDITIPTLPAIDAPADEQKYARANRAQGKHPWFYSCVNYGITIPEVAVRDRLLPLFAFNSNMEGYLFWSLNWYDTPQPDFPKTPWAQYRNQTGTASALVGDGTLIYPPAVRGGTPMPSTRLENFRDGMEDYEFLHTLSLLYAQKKSTLTPRQRQSIERALSLNILLQSAWEHPEQVSQRRQEVGMWIDTLAQK